MPGQSGRYWRSGFTLFVSKSSMNCWSMKRGLGSAYKRYSQRMEESDQPWIYKLIGRNAFYSADASNNRSSSMLWVIGKCQHLLFHCCNALAREDSAYLYPLDCKTVSTQYDIHHLNHHICWNLGEGFLFHQPPPITFLPCFQPVGTWTGWYCTSLGTWCCLPDIPPEQELYRLESSDR